MHKYLSGRSKKSVLALAALALLTAGKATVVPIPQVMMHADTGHAKGESFIVHNGDVIMRARIYDAEVVTIDAPITVSLSRFSQTLAAGTRLEPELVSGDTSSLIGTKGRYYCGENQRARSELANFLVGGLFSKYEAEVRFCFVDSDKDGKLDKYFLAGAKDKTEQGARDIEPVSFTTKMLQPDTVESYIELRVEKFKPESNKLEMRLYVKRGDRDVPFDYILTITGGKADHTYPALKTDPKKVPYPAYFNDVLGGGVGVMNVDAVKGEAEVQITRPFRSQLFKPISIVYQVIYIYY